MATKSYFIKKGIVQKLLDDVYFRMRLAIHVKLGERAVYNFAQKYLEDPIPDHHLTRKVAIDFFMEEGYSEEEILTTEKPA